MSLAEILYLLEKNRIGVSLAGASNSLRRFPKCEKYPLNLAVISAVSQSVIRSSALVKTVWERIWNQVCKR